jgi:hypothetical protein
VCFPFFCRISGWLGIHLLQRWVHDFSGLLCQCVKIEKFPADRSKLRNEGGKARSSSVCRGKFSGQPRLIRRLGFYWARFFVGWTRSILSCQSLDEQKFQIRVAEEGPPYSLAEFGTFGKRENYQSLASLSSGGNNISGSEEHDIRTPTLGHGCGLCQHCVNLVLKCSIMWWTFVVKRLKSGDSDMLALSIRRSRLKV